MTKFKRTNIRFGAFKRGNWIFYRLGMIQSQSIDDPIRQLTADCWNTQQATSDTCCNQLAEIGLPLMQQSLQLFDEDGVIGVTQASG